MAFKTLFAVIFGQATDNLDDIMPLIIRIKNLLVGWEHPTMIFFKSLKSFKATLQTITNVLYEQNWKKILKMSWL